jgi:predicted Zn-dependent protease
VLDSEEINAFTTGGGYVYITRGILTYLNNEAELEAVLGHEIGHVCARHPVRQQSKSTLAGIGAAAGRYLHRQPGSRGLANYAGAALVSGYGRDQELEADRLGAEYLVKTGYSPQHMVDVVRLLKNQELLEIQRAREENRQPHVYHGVLPVHPDNDSRLHEVVAARNQLQNKADPRDPEHDKYLKTIEGLPVGTSAAQGVLKGNRFYHSDLGLTMVFPSGWHVENRADSLVAISPNKESVIQMQTQAPPPNTVRANSCRACSRSTAPARRAARSERFAGLHDDRALGAHDFGIVPARYAVIYYNNLAYVFSAASKGSAGAPAADPLFMSTIKTFRRMKQTEFAQAEPLKIKIIRADENTRVADLAKKSPLPKYAEQQLRLLNDLYPDKDRSRVSSSRSSSSLRPPRPRPPARCLIEAARSCNSARPTLGHHMAEKKFELTESRERQEVDVEVKSGTLGPDVLNIANITRDHGVYTFDPGFMATAACESRITFIDGDQGRAAAPWDPDRAARREEQLPEKSRTC